MMLSYPILENSIKFEENIIDILVIENPKYYRDFIEQIWKLERDMDSTAFLSVNYEIINFAKTAQVIYFYGDMDFNNRKIIAKIIRDIIAIANEEYYLETIDLISRTHNYISDILSELNIELSYEDIDIESLLKSIKLSVSEEYTTLLSKICDYIDLINQIFGKKIFIFFNFDLSN